MTAPRRPAEPDFRRNRRTAMLALGLAIAMMGLAYASVPLYRLFCQATGYAGTPQRAETAPANSSQRIMTIRFDANVSAGLAWDFRPVQVETRVKLGEQTLAFYRATNRSARALTATAVFNVTPGEAGAYFDKIQCFCFTEQTLGPGQSADLPVVFFIDPAIEQDEDLRQLETITLSYTFYPAPEATSVSTLDAVSAEPTPN